MTDKTDIPKLIPPHGGYAELQSYKMSEIVYDATVVFCDRFINIRSRTHDQMVQAARSGKQNIAEGSIALVMISQLCYKNSVFGRPVDKPVFVVDTARPVAGKPMLEGFGFAGASERIMHDFVNKPVYAFEHLFVGLLAIEIVFPGVFRKDEFHSESLRALPPPCSSSAMDSRSLFALLGTRSRYAVSSSALKSSRESITTDSSFCLVMMTGSWLSQTSFMVVARLVLAAEYVIVFIGYSLYMLLYNTRWKQSREAA
jgi:hypothetical protein